MIKSWASFYGNTSYLQKQNPSLLLDEILSRDDAFLGHEVLRKYEIFEKSVHIKHRSGFDPLAIFESLKKYKPTLPKGVKLEKKDANKCSGVILRLTCLRMYFQFIANDEQVKTNTKKLMLRFCEKEKVVKPWHLTICRYLYEIKNHDEEQGDEDVAKNLFELRAIIKNNYGELGDKMSQNAYEIYQLLKKLYLEGGRVDITYDRVRLYLKKACNYSTRETRGSFLIDLVKEHHF
mmetsp:Transcript_34610/g.33816  ORF Transcript_34610/g.33816 Transcript_34610/m.33816 type:complete len:235 (+) Transcript_34610:889-1593(+)